MTQNNWIQHIATAVDEASEVPLFGNPPEFNLELFTEQLRERLQLGDLEIEMINQEWTKGSDLLARLDDNPSVMSFSLSPLDSHLFWAMSHTDLEEFSSWTISHDQEQFQFQDRDIQKGYYHFLMLEALLTLRNSSIYPDLSPKLEQAKLVESDSYTIDISLKRQGKSVWGRLIIPKPFQIALNSHFKGKLPSVRELKTKRKVMLETELTAGTVSLSAETLKQLSVGDFIILDHCTYHPNTKKGYLLMKMGSQPLAQMKLKEDHLKVLDYAYAIEGKNMDYDEPFEDDEEMMEAPIDEAPPAEDPLDNPAVAPKEEVPPMEEEQPVAEEAPVEQAAAPETVVEQAAEPQMVHPNQVPLTLSVEVAKLNISLEKLVELAPGNVLKTGIYPEQGVRLSVNGRTIGKGELLQVGDALGVKIIEIAKEA